MEKFKGYIENILFRNEENGYTVMSVSGDEADMPCVGVFSYVGEGEYVEVEGEIVIHPTYGEQMKVEKYHILKPTNEEGIIRYLGSGAIKGIKMATATKIVDKFGNDTFDIIENEPERLAEIKGITKKKALDIAEQVSEKKDMRDAMMFMSDYGISMNLSVKIYEFYGNRIYEVLKNNPYRMAEDVDGVGFKTVDEIGLRSGIDPESEFRIKSGILYALSTSAADGNVYMTDDELIAKSREILRISNLDINRYLDDLVMEKKVVIIGKDDKRQIYAGEYYYVEDSIAYRLDRLNVNGYVNEEKVKEKIKLIEEAEGISLDIKQETAVIETIKNGVLIITGGPGTGKTTTIKTIIKFFETENKEILLAAPTGRAAKRMKETTGYEAQTIHRMLEMSGNPELSSNEFEKNESNPLEADLIIVDEMSMVDIFLMNSLLKAIPEQTRLVMVGDVNQLPSVGPGNVLKDIINSERFNVVKLDKIFRQENTGDIVLDAHKINKGEKVDLTKKSNDFLFIKENDSNRLKANVYRLLTEKLPGYVGCDVSEIQILTPAKKGVMGTVELNKYIQGKVNPKAYNKREIEHNEMIFREGDKVMQIKNDYQLEWKIKNRYGIEIDEGKGVFNGDIGIITKVNNLNQDSRYVEVLYDDNKYAVYSVKNLDELELAYAVTVHKSQGSEYPAVIMPMYTGPRLLMNKSLLYTAVTRAKKCVCMIGSPEAFYDMAGNDTRKERHSGLKDRILERIP